MTILFAASVPVTYTLVDWVDQEVTPWQLNDQPLPVVAASTLPQVRGIVYPAGSTATLVFAALSLQDRTWITQACAKPVTLTLPAGTEPAWVRATGTASLTGVTLVVTLTQDCPIGYFTRGLGFY